MKAFVSVLCLFGVNNRNENIRNLWGDGPLSRPAFKATKPVNKFESIHCYLRFDGMNAREKKWAQDKFALYRNVNFFLEKMQIKSQTIIRNLHQQKTHSNLLSIAISSIMSSKPGKYVIKLFLLKDCNTG